MRLPPSLSRTRLLAAACTALALTLLPSQGQSQGVMNLLNALGGGCLLYTSPSPRDS